MKKHEAKITKLCLYLVSAVLAIYLTVDLAQYLEQRAALRTQWQRIQQVNQDLDRQYQQQLEQYSLEMAVWREQQQRITNQNQLRVQRWQQNPVIRERKVIETLAREVTADTDTDAGMVAALPQLIEEEITVERPRPPPQLVAVPEPPQAPTRVKISADSIELELAKDTSWQTVAQLLILLLGLYGGIRVINKLTRSEEPEAA